MTKQKHSKKDQAKSLENQVDESVRVKSAQDINAEGGEDVTVEIGEDVADELHTQHSEHEQQQNHRESTQAFGHGSTEDSPKAKAKKPEFELNFKGSEILRAQFPKTFKAVEVAAGDWVNDGDFKEIPVDNPAAKELLALGLKKAKDTEQKIMQSKAVEQATMKAFEMAMKANETIQTIKSQILKK